MTCQQAGWVSFREYSIRRRVHEDKEREDWSKRRWELFILMQMHPHIKAHNKPHTPDRWITFPWEKAAEPAKDSHVISNQEIDKLTDIFAKRK